MATEQFLADKSGAWSNAKHRDQWGSTLRAYAYPKIGALAVSSIGTPEVIRVLGLIWNSKPETASRVRQRIERILNWATVSGYRTGENPARWRGHLDNVYQPPSRVRPVRHHAAIAVDEMPAVYRKLRDVRKIGALATRFAILTAARAGEVLGATWDEIDFEAKVWTVPAARMKARRSHRVPLSSEALEVLHEAKELRNSARVFPGYRAGSPLSHTALVKALRQTGALDATTHGCRSTFKDWASERTSVPFEVSEMALAHAIGDRTEAAYRRGELMEKRAALMEQWSHFLLASSISQVVSIAGRQRARRSL